MSLTLGTLPNQIVFSRVSDRSVVRQHQAETISAAITPERSRYGTIQQPGVAITNSPKLLWILSGVPVNGAELDILEAMVEDNDNFSYAFVDALFPARRGKPSYSTNVRLVVAPDWLGESYFDPTIAANIWLVNLTLVEI